METPTTVFPKLQQHRSLPRPSLPLPRFPGQTLPSSATLDPVGRTLRPWLKETSGHLCASTSPVSAAKGVRPKDCPLGLSPGVVTH